MWPFGERQALETCPICGKRSHCMFAPPEHRGPALDRTNSLLARARIAVAHRLQIGGERRHPVVNFRR
jgi:hypothetical protein